MNNSILLATFFCLALASADSLGVTVPADRSPNILVILTDDHGWADLGVQGADPDLQTPNLDRLAKDGVRFTRGYVTAPQCTPSRVGLLSGTYQQRFNVEENGLPMRAGVVTLAERLKTGGYINGISGKWGLDIYSPREVGVCSPTDTRKPVLIPELGPQMQGFDEYFTGNMREYAASHALDGRAFPDTPHQVHEEGCRVVIQTEAALSFLQRRAGNPAQPWFLYLSYMAPHVPLEYPEPWFSKTPAHLPQERRSALALLAAIDDGVGRVRQRLAEMGQEKDTLVFFLGDNGAPLLPKNWNGSSNLPMRGEKGMLSEGGIRVPFLAAWPGRIPAGRAYDHPVISLDIAATALAAAGLPGGQELDGVNLLPFLTGQNDSAPHQALYWRWRSQAAIQEFPYKLITMGDRERMLFDITRPGGESYDRNLIATHPEIAARLEEKLNAWTNRLQPKGMPSLVDPAHESLFAKHGINAGANATAQVSDVGSVQGWRGINCALEIQEGMLAVKNTGGSPFYLTCTKLDMEGPVRATLRVRASQGGRGRIAWRTQDGDFSPQSSVFFDWPAPGTLGEVAVTLPVQGSLAHIRIFPPAGLAGFQVHSVALSGGGRDRVWQFGSAGKETGPAAAGASRRELEEDAPVQAGGTRMPDGNL